MILRKAAEFVWSKGTRWTSLPEIKLIDAEGQSAGNIDYVIVKYDASGQIIDFASIEVQGVYISGNMRNPFQNYMEQFIRQFGISFLFLSPTEARRAQSFHA